MKIRKTPLELGALCPLCPFSVGGNPARFVLGEGPKDAVGIFIGESPGADEVERQRPFVGTTGRQLDESFVNVRLPRANLFVVNAVACRPPPPKSEAAMRRAADCCRPALLAQLSRLKNVNTLPVFCAGKWALYGLTGDIKGIKTHRGFIKKWEFHDSEEINNARVKKLEKKRVKQSKRKRQLGRPGR